MSTLDWAVVTLYATGLILLSVYLSKGQTSAKDYYLGGRTFRWWQIGLSTMATQLGAVSFISAPAFVGYREGGGLIWLSYEFAVPLAMIVLIVILFPPLYRSGVISIYSYLENRFNRNTRRLLSAVFQFSRAFASGITVYAVAIVLEAVFQIPVWINIIAVGVVALIYDTLGGMKAVVYSDVIQMAILFVGFILCSFIALDLLGGWQLFTESLDPARLKAIDFSSTGIIIPDIIANAGNAANIGVGAGTGSESGAVSVSASSGGEFGFLPMITGGFFLYAAYYGCDQSQAQRILSAMSLKEARKALLFNGFMRFPTVLLYCLMGLLIGTYALTTTEFSTLIPVDKPDYLVPVFIANYLPAGAVGLLVAAIMAAAMSSLDSALNSLSAATLQDFVIPAKKGEMTEQEQFRMSKYLTIAWGAVTITLAFFAGAIAPTIIEAINKIGSLFYGPIIATFLIAMLSKKISGPSVNAGIIAGVLVNVILWLFFEDNVFWFWWNATGFASTVAVAALWERGNSAKEIMLLLGYFFLIILISYTLGLWLL